MGLVLGEEGGEVKNADALVVCFGLAGASDEDFGVGIINGEQRSDLASEGLFGGDVG